MTFWSGESVKEKKENVYQQTILNPKTKFSVRSLPEPSFGSHHATKERAENAEESHHPVAASPPISVHQSGGDGSEEESSNSGSANTNT